MTRIIVLVPMAIGFGSWLPIAVADDPCEDCGPGQHWIHSPTCPAGQDTMTSTAVVGIDMTGDCVADDSMILDGPTTVNRSAALDDSAQFPGTRPVDLHLDVIDTEIVSLSLTGIKGATLTVGYGLGTNPLGHSYGAVAEKPSDAARADSFFDVYFEVDLGGGNLAYNHVPARLVGEIDCAPPQATYIYTGCLPLYSLPTGGGQIPGMNLVSARHITFPPETIPAVSHWGFAVMGILLLTAGTLAIRGRRMRVAGA